MNTLLKLHKSMFLIRYVEEKIASEYANGDMRCPVHLSIGQEAAASGVIMHLNPNDKLFSNHRCHAHYLAKGGSLKKMLCEIHGKHNGCINGIGGSMHLQDITVGLEASIPIVSSAISLATGFALTQKRKENRGITVIYIGDAALEEGIFHECSNFASLHKLPLLFVCENNLYSVYTDLKKRQIDDNFARYAQTFNTPYLRLDGNKVDEVYNKSIKAINYVKSGKGPYFLQLDTYRYREHCGPSFDDHLNYRNKNEIKKWNAKCPLNYSRQLLLKRGFKKQLDHIEINIKKEVETAFNFAKKSKLPNKKEATKYVYA